METMPYVASVSGAKLIVMENDEIRCISLDARNEWKIGRVCPGNSPDIRLSSQIAGRKQGEFLRADNTWYFVDGKSLNGTFYNERKILHGPDGSVMPVPLKNGDMLRVDANNLNMPDMRGVWMMFTTDQVSDIWESKVLNTDRDTYIGRYEDQNDIVIPVPYVSGNHTRISFYQGRFYVSDCNSLSGTWVNGNRVIGTVMLKEKDKISICDSHFIFTGNKLIYSVSAIKMEGNQMMSSGNKRLVLQADIKSRKVPNNNGQGKKELIRDVKLEVKEGTLVALLGSSGAGKSTVMNCLNGMDSSGTEGTVLFNGEDLFANFERLKYLIGSVPQKPVLHTMLTVQEELMEAARIRLPKDVKTKEIKQYVDNAIKQLNLDAKRKTRIQKCSGGEQQRVNIGIELVANRTLLCLDEPDAGLDPGMKNELFTILRNLAHNENKSILVIIHDVSDIDLFDQVVMMTKYQDVGRLAFSGTPAEAREYFGTDLKHAYSLLSEQPEKYIK